MTDELKPCPFCGGMPELESDGYGSIYMLCECGVATSEVDIDNELDAIARWNRRALDD